MVFVLRFWRDHWLPEGGLVLDKGKQRKTRCAPLLYMSDCTIKSKSGWLVTVVCSLFARTLDTYQLQKGVLLIRQHVCIHRSHLKKLIFCETGYYILRSIQSPYKCLQYSTTHDISDILFPKIILQSIGTRILKCQLALGRNISLQHEKSCFEFNPYTWNLLAKLSETLSHPRNLSILKLVNTPKTFHALVCYFIKVI